MKIQRRNLKKLFVALVAAEILIVLADVFLNHFEWIPYSPMQRAFNITREDSISNWFSSMQTFVSALVLLLIYFVYKAKAQTKKQAKRARGWAFLAVIFAFISLDDGSKLHERLGSTFADIAEDTGYLLSLFDLFPSYSWQIAVGPVFLAIAIFIAIFLWRQLGRSKALYAILGAILLLAIAVGMDFLEGLDTGVFEIHVVEHFMKVGEEFIEMLANTILLITFLGILSRDAWLAMKHD